MQGGHKKSDRTASRSDVNTHNQHSTTVFEGWISARPEVCTQDFTIFGQTIILQGGATTKSTLLLFV